MMADEPKRPAQPNEPGEPSVKKPVAEGAEPPTPPAAAEKAAEAAPPKPAAAVQESAVAKSPETAKPAEVAKPATSAPPGAAPAKPAPPAKLAAAGAAKAPPPPPKPPVKPEPWSSPLVDEIRKRFPDAVKEAVIFRNQPCVTLAKDSLIKVCEFLKSNEGGVYAFLTDETAVDYPKREKRFEVIYQLYSFTGNNRLRLKVLVGEGEKVPSVVSVWPTADWLEREVYDMFGVLYEGHPDLKRILLPDGWVGHPLRKDYDILRQDQEWVKANLGIESGQ